ncbi:hypothetical protein K456DRAFT_393537 [Colletotrichum gloeosporioides 23]|nr:hypothetical protein K456DRAFT_393537 [Colletotrichum gloeosporioides 23]
MAQTTGTQHETGDRQATGRRRRRRQAGAGAGDRQAQAQETARRKQEAISILAGALDIGWMDEWMEGRKETHRICSFRHFKHDGGSSFSHCLPHQTRICVQSIPAGHNSASSIPTPTSMARTRNYHQSNPNSPHRSHRDRRRWPPPASTTAAKRINTSTSPPLQEQEQEHAHDTARCQLPSIDSASVCFFVICIRHRRLISHSVQHHLCSRIQAMETLTTPIQITKHHIYRRHRNAAH